MDPKEGRRLDDGAVSAAWSDPTLHLDSPPKPVGDRTLRLAGLICAVILTLAALSLARTVMIPVAFALFVIALVWPLQRRLKRKLPQLVAVLMTAAVALLAIGIGYWLIVWGFGRIAQWVIANSARLQSLYMQAADLLEQRGLYAAELVAEQFNMSWIVGVLRGIGGSLQGVVTFALVTFMFVILVCSNWSRSGGASAKSEAALLAAPQSMPQRRLRGDCRRTCLCVSA